MNGGCQGHDDELQTGGWLVGRVAPQQVPVPLWMNHGTRVVQPFEVDFRPAVFLSVSIGLDNADKTYSSSRTGLGGSPPDTSLPSSVSVEANTGDVA